jgi:lipoate-protein ligase A
VKEQILFSLKNGIENLFYFVANTPTCFVGYGNSVDPEACRKSGLQIIELPNQGGTIISGSGSLSVGYISKYLNNTFNAELTQYLCDWLISRGLQINVFGNDILVDGIYKVASSGTRQIGNLLFSTFHISCEVDMGAINSVCTKEMVKIPKGLIEYGIMSYEIENIFLQFAQKYFQNY